jgi:CDP-diacylglycerol pyrophosphatase
MLPRRDANCGVSECKKTNEVWALNTQYAALRDIKMCGCPAEFIHGLAMPREVITGVEDLNRQEGIWQFAWDVATERIELDSIALVVNPKSQRTQNQLHIHLVRLDKNARTHLSQYLPVQVNNLESIWATAANAARAKGLDDYGVLVAQSSSSGYMVVVTANSPEAAFTIWKCE